jgi:autotransporter passenger strand-loop-strand repeat protein
MLGSGGEQTVVGKAVGTRVGGSGFQAILPGGTAIGAMVGSGGFQIVESAGVAISTTIAGSGVQQVTSGATASATTVSGAAALAFVFSGATGIGATLSKGGFLDVDGGALTSATVKAGALLEVQSSGTMTSAAILSGGFLEMFGPGSAGGVVSSGGTLELFDSGQDMTGLALRAGAVVVVGQGHVASGNISSGITELVENGGIQSGGAILSAGILEIPANGVVSVVTVSSGGKLFVFGGGTDVGASVSAGGTVNVSAGGVDFSASIGSGGVLDAAGGVTVSSLLLGGQEIVAIGGAASATILSGTARLIVSAGGAALGAEVGSRSASGGMTVLAHGFASGTVIDSGGTEFVSGGTDLSADVQSGGVLQVRAGGSAIVATVESGGEMIVFSGGTGIGLTVASGGSGIVSAGGVIVLTGSGTSEIDGLLVNSGTVLANSGTLLVSGSVVNSGGTLFASGAASLIDVFGVVTGGVTKIGNGVVDFEGSSGENVTFLANGSGGLVLADSVADPTAYVGRISGFGGANHANKVQFIDLASVTSDVSVSLSYVPFASHTSGTLFVSSGGSTVAEITFLGSGYVTSNFHITSGTGGTVEITDPLAAEAQGGIAFGAATTLAYAQNGGKAGVSLTAAHGAHAAGSRCSATTWRRLSLPPRTQAGPRQSAGRGRRPSSSRNSLTRSAADRRVPSGSSTASAARGRRCAWAADMAIARAPKYRCRNKSAAKAAPRKYEGRGERRYGYGNDIWAATGCRAQRPATQGGHRLDDRHGHRVVRLLSLRHRGRSCLRQALLSARRPLRGHSSRLRHLLHRLRRPPRRGSDLRPLRRPHRPQSHADRHAPLHGHRYLPRRLRADLRVDRHLGSRDPDRLARRAGHWRRRGVGRVGASGHGMVAHPGSARPRCLLAAIRRPLRAVPGESGGACV